MNKQKLLKKVSPIYLNGICHRGLHDDIAPENSIAAFKKAIDAGFAFECDVHITKDNEILVMHDSDLERMTGKKGVIEELTFDEIRNNYKLRDGSNIPLLTEVLELNNEQVPMAIELKVVKNNYKPLAKKFCEIMKKYIKDKSMYFLISFDPRSLWRCKKLKLVNGIIIGYDVPWTFKLRHTCHSIDFDYKRALEPKSIKYHKNHFINVWTIETKEAFNEIKDYVDTVTFQHLDPLWIKEQLNSRK